MVVELGVVCAQYVVVWVCPQTSGGISQWGSQRSVGGPFAGILGQTAGYAFLQFSSPSFLSSSPPTPSHCDFFSEKQVPPAAACMARQTPTYHLHPPLLCQNVCTSPRPPLPLLPLLPLTQVATSSKIPSTYLRVHTWMDHLDAPVCCADVLIFCYANLISYKIEGERKKERLTPP